MSTPFDSPTLSGMIIPTYNTFPFVDCLRVCWVGFKFITVYSSESILSSYTIPMHRQYVFADGVWSLLSVRSLAGSVDYEPFYITQFLGFGMLRTQGACEYGVGDSESLTSSTFLTYTTSQCCIQIPYRHGNPSWMCVVASAARKMSWKLDRYSSVCNPALS